MSAAAKRVGEGRAPGQRQADLGPPGPRWFVVQTKIHQEKEAAKEIRRQGFEAYLPVVQGHPKSKNPIQPLFLRYLFARFDPTVQQWLAICSTPGVHDIIRRGDGRPVAMPDKWIGRVKAQEVDGFVQLIARPVVVAPFQKGDRVRVVAGNFIGFDAAFDRQLDASGRIAVLMSAFGRLTPIELTLDQVAALPET